MDSAKKYRESAKGKAYNKAYKAIWSQKPEQIAKRKQWKIDNPEKAAFLDQRAHSKERGIGFELTFKEWLGYWTPENFAQRGKNGLVMSRHDDKGPYAIGNVAIITAAQNTRDIYKRVE